MRDYTSLLDNPPRLGLLSSPNIRTNKDDFFETLGPLAPDWREAGLWHSDCNHRGTSVYKDFSVLIDTHMVNHTATDVC